MEGQLGLEKTPEEYVAKMVKVFREVWRVLRDDGTLWLNMGDSYAGSGKGPSSGLNKEHHHLEHKTGGIVPVGLKPKDLCGIPWMLAFALRADGWYLRQDIIWHKPNPMPESCRDRCTKAHEYIFLMTKKPRYFYDAEAIREQSLSPDPRTTRTPDQIIRKEPLRNSDLGRYGTTRGNKSQTCCPAGGRNKRSVWTVPTYSFPKAHFATFPPKLIEPCILAGTSLRGCCPECRAPWARVMEKDRQSTRPAINNVNDPTGMANRDPQRHVTTTTTTGWRPGCDCGADPIPCTVLDPFMGAGTTGLVAAQYGRSYFGIELNPEYIEMANDRISRAMRPQSHVSTNVPDDAPLFGVAPSGQ